MPKDQDQEGKTLTRKELIQQLYPELGSYTAAKAVLYHYFEAIEEGLLKEGVVKLHNFGRFETSRKNERMGRNPRSGEAKVISARTIVKFKPCNKLRNAARYPLQEKEESHD